MCLYLVTNEVILNSLYDCHGNIAMTMAMNKVQLDALLLENIENATPSLLSSCFSASIFSSNDGCNAYVY